MPANYVLLSKVTVGAAGAASVTMANIPQSGYTDLKVVASVRSTKADTSDYIYFTFSGSSSYAATKILFGSGSSAGSFNWSTVSGITGGIINAASNTASTFSSVDIYIPNYTASQYKSVSIDTVQEGNTGSGIYATMMAGLSNSNTAISTITFANESGSNFIANSTFYLYGLAAVGTTPVIAPFASGGDVVTNDGTYWYHAFLSSGTFTPAKALTCDALVVAGGGGTLNSGGENGGGGGAGGVLAFASQALTSNTANTVTVGAGGTFGSSGTNGVNSQFASLTASVGGGRGGYGSATTGSSGGSGGGGGNGTNGGTATSGQGNAGGNGVNSAPHYGAGGGGGAGGAGSSGAGGGGAGGAGVNTVTNWGAIATALSNAGIGASGYIAGGGGGSGNTTGGTGGAGGGGGGGNSTAAGITAGQVNTGSGGGGGRAGVDGAAGGSGFVIVRYLMA
jgi:hypothetical protein